MGLQETQRRTDLQQSISDRLAELGYADTEGARRLAVHIAEVAVIGQDLSTNTLSLFLSVDCENTQALGQVAIAIKLQLETMTDALVDLRQELPDWSEFFLTLSNREQER